MAGFSRYGRLGLWLILALALGLRVWTLGDKNLWLDESSSWEVATSSVTQLVTVTAEDPHPPLYFLVLKGWIAIFGDSVIALRSLSVASGLLAVYLAFRLAAICLGRGASHAVLLWFAVSPNAIYFSQEARVYALATAAVLGMCLAYRRWVDSDFRSWPALVAYGGCGAAGLYLHYFTALPVVAIWLHAIFLATRRSFSWRPWLLVHAGIALLYSPWMGPALAQFERGQPWWRRQVGWEQIPGYAADLLRELTFGIYGVPIVGTVTGAVGICVLGIGLVGIAAVIVRKLEERDVFVALIALTPVLLGLALLPVTGHMELSRYLSYATPLLFLAAAKGLGSFGLRPRDVIAILVIGSVAMLPSLRTYYLSPAKDSDPRPIEAYLRDAARPEPEAPDTIFVAPGYMTAVLRGELRGNLEYRRLSGDADLRRVLADVPSPHHATWLIVDYRWPGFNEISRDDRVTEAHVPSGMPGRIKLFRVLPK